MPGINVDGSALVTPSALSLPDFTSGDANAASALARGIAAADENGITDAMRFQRIAQVHGGTLHYADRAGGGAVFTLTVSLSSDAPVGAA